MFRQARTFAIGLAIIALATGAVQGSVLTPRDGAAFSASKSDITPNGLHVRIAEIPGVLQSRFHYDQTGNFLYSVVVDLKTKQIVGFNDRGSSEDRDVERSDMGPPANFTGIWRLGSFPGGGQLYGEYESGVRVGTIVVQPDGTIIYYPR